MNKNKQIGCITELTVMRSFMELGYNVSSPYGDCERYDFIADINGHLIRVQCKTASTESNDDFVEIDFRKKRYVSGKMVNIIYTSDEIDYYATCYKGKTYLIPFNSAGRNKKRLRLREAKNNNRKNTNPAEEYEIETVINNLIKTIGEENEE